MEVLLLICGYIYSDSDWGVDMGGALCSECHLSLIPIILCMAIAETDQLWDMQRV